MKTAIAYADGVIIGNENVNPELTKFLADSKQKVLPVQPKETYVDDISDFFDNILLESID